MPVAFAGKLLFQPMCSGGQRRLSHPFSGGRRRRFENIPLVSAAALRFEGRLMSVLPGKGNPCYRCYIPEPPPAGMVPSCQEAGVLGAVVGRMGTLQTAEALKILLGLGRLFSHSLLIFDALEGSFRSLKRAADPECPLCGKNSSITDLVEYDPHCTVRPGSGEGFRAHAAGSSFLGGCGKILLPEYG
ncbi:MAG: ThiF family adenylyltransferase [Armatimonadetes bacterium]|nr:ThiF family adenylyltransferase [Armatimonadota bacterium]